jgi:hypothetical protein
MPIKARAERVCLSQGEERGGEERREKDGGVRRGGIGWVELFLGLEGGMKGWAKLRQPNIRGGLIGK